MNGTTGLTAWHEDEQLTRELAEAGLAWFNQRLHDAELADAIEAALRTRGRCLVKVDEACDLGCGAIECRRHDPGS